MPPHAARPDPRGFISNRREDGTHPANAACEFKTPARRQTQRFIPPLLEQLPPAGIERRRRRMEGHSQAPLFELATQLIKILYGLV